MADEPIPPKLGAGPERTWEVLCHLSALAGYLLSGLSVIGPLIVWLMKKGEYPSVDAHGKEALNFHISVLIYALVCLPLVLLFIGFPLLIAVGIFGLVCTIIGGVKASNGELFRYPLSIRFLK